MSVLLFRPRATGAPPAAVSGDIPTAQLSISWTTNPADTQNPSDVSTYLRAIQTRRGRSYEYDRIETGVASYLLDNRDSRFDPANTLSPYYPNVKPTRRTQASAVWQSTVYPIFHGFTEGFPNAFPGDGYDATVGQQASDWFYPLNMLKFAPASTELVLAVETVPAAGTQERLRLVSTDLPLPQALPFVIQVGTGDDMERMQVVAAPFPRLWDVLRGHENSQVVTHPAGSPVRAEVFRFAEEQSGTRINNCLDLLGVSSVDRDIDPGNSLIAASDDLSGASLLEHMLLVAQAENGRLFASPSGLIRFRERHWQFTPDAITQRTTFGPGVGEIPFLSGPTLTLAYEDAKLYNRVRIVLPDGRVAEALDQDSIDQHFERVLELQWPLASVVEAQDAADYMLDRLTATSLRVPAIKVRPSGDDWHTVLGLELADRVGLKADPPVGVTALNEVVVIERIGHDVRPGDWTVTLEFSEADTTVYWQLGVGGFGELGSTTRLAY